MRSKSALMDRPEIYVIRHGETEWSLAGRHTGRTEVPLAENGEKQAKILGTRLRTLNLCRVLTSPRQRAARTCDLAELTLPAEVVPDLSEWDYGEYEGITTAEVCVRRPGWNIFKEGCPGGESPSDVSERADRVIERVKALRGKTAIFSHGHFGRVLAARWIGLPTDAAQHFSLDPAMVNTLGYYTNDAEVRVIALLNGVP